jgi:hypothetical protein
MTRHEVGNLSWEVTDKYGWPVEKAAIRDVMKAIKGMNVVNTQKINYPF